MRFGCEFYTLQDPKWADAYLDYNTLKQILKQSRFEGDRHGAFQRTVAQQTARISSFLQKQESLLHRWSTAVLSRFSISTASSLLGATVFASVPAPELRDLESCLLEILGFVGRLDAFIQLNQYAIDKILAKPGAPALELTELSTHSRAQIVRLSKDILHQVQVALNSEVGTRGLASLVLRSVSPTALGCSVEKIHESIAVDDSAALMVVMASPVPYLENQAMLYSVLQVAILHKARNCTQSLLDEITVPLGDDKCGHQDPLHQLIIQAFRAKPGCSLSSGSVAERDLLGDTFRQLSPYQHHMLFAKDWRGRTPLHYAAQYGLAEVCFQAIKFMGAPAVLQEDAFGETPLYLALSSNHGAVLDLFLEVDSQRPIGAPSMVTEQYAGYLLGIAVLSSIEPPRSPECTPGIQIHHIQALASLCKGANIRDKRGRTPLHIAAEYGKVEIAEAILASGIEVAIDHTDAAYGWTPLIAASANGHYDVARVLLLAGADAASLDRQGWSAIEHAAYRAHMPVVALLESALPTTVGPEDGKISVAVPMSYSNTSRPSSPIVSVEEEDTSLAQLHSSCTSIFVDIGSFDVDDRDQAVALEAPLGLQAKPGALSNDMLLEVSAPGCPETPRSLRIPYIGDAPTDTWRFSTQDISRAKLAFKLFQGTRGHGDGPRLVGAGICLLSSMARWFATEQQSLRRDTRVALTNTDGDFVGSVCFTFIVSSPYIPKHMPGPPQKMKSQPTAQVVGHRGLGLNEHEVRRLQMGEHTVASLLGAVAHGADLVEFDVQVTRDGVPVVYHDWAVSETGLDAPVHDMTHRQWMAISDAQAAAPAISPRGRLPWDERDRPPATEARRTSRSLCGRPGRGDEGARALLERMRHTVDYATRQAKGNTRGGAFIHSAFATLAEILDALPPGVGCDVELKYPMLADATAWGIAPYAAEMNRFVDAVLDVVFDRAAADAAAGAPRRPLFFTCFHPDVCVLLAAKQRTYPVLFLNDSRVSGPPGDRRAASLQQALRFARRWRLAGVVMAAEPLVAAPALIRRLVKARGLFCASYGALNDVPALARAQAAAGLDALIVNNVRLIAQALKMLAQTETETGETTGEMEIEEAMAKMEAETAMTA